MQKSCFRSKVEVLRARQINSARATYFHGDVDGGCAEANAVSDAVVVLCLQNVCFCYCMCTLLANMFFAFAAKLHFVCIFINYPVPPSWLHGVLLSSDHVKIQSLCLQFAYFVKTVKINKHTIYFRVPSLASPSAGCSAHPSAEHNFKNGGRFLCF